MIDDERPDAPEEQPAEPETPGGEEEALEPSSSADPSEAPTAGEDAPEEPAAEEPAAEAPEEPAPAPEEVAAPDASSQPAEADAEATEERPKRDKKKKDEDKPAEVVPGAHLEPDLVLESERSSDDDLSRYGAPEDGEPAAEGDGSGDAAPEPAPRSVLDLAADARYRATGKRKTAVARVIISPGDGNYTINGRTLENFFPRAALQKTARQPLEVAGFESRMNVVARIHGGGVSAQAGALRHGVARALVEADPSLRPELKRQGLLTRDARAKERKKAGLKKARKRPQFSKR